MNQRMLCSNPDNLIRIKNNETIRISGIEMTAFSKSHDCADPVSFVISSPKTNKKISVITDLGEINESAVDAISESDFLAIESNYDEKMLEVGPYPYFLKQRIAGPGGHLSNRISSLKVLENSKSRLKNILLCHLSKVNNSPDNALKTFSQTLRHRTDLSPKIRVAPRYFHTELLRI
jgi:phosphoribosyl 1,2-cyclic phosphodiesterase